MMTTEASSTTMSWATAMTASALKRLGSPAGGRGHVLVRTVKVVVMMGSPVSVAVVPESPGGLRSETTVWGGSRFPDRIALESEYRFHLDYTEREFRLSTGEGRISVGAKSDGSGRQ